MKKLSFLNKAVWGACFFTSSIFAVDVDPWIPPQGQYNFSVQYLYTWQDLFQSPAGSFNQPGSVHEAMATLQAVPLPKCDVQVEFDFGGDSSISFNYAAVGIQGRCQLLDEDRGHFISLVPGIEVIFAQQDFLNDNNFYYIGPFNALFSCSIGKSFYCADREDWISRVWFYQAYGIANQGLPWVTGLWNFSYKLSPNLIWSFYSPYSFGTGHDNVLEDAPFTGYGSIDYQFMDLYTSFEYDLPRNVSITFWAFHNLYARNSSKNYYGGGASLSFPLFSPN